MKNKTKFFTLLPMAILVLALSIMFAIVAIDMLYPPKSFVDLIFGVIVGVVAVVCFSVAGAITDIAVENSNDKIKRIWKGPMKK